MSLLLRLLLALGYPLLAHAASVHGDGRWAALALADVVVFMLIDGLLERRIGAWLACVAALAGLVALARSPWSMALLLLVPVLFIWMIAWVFARTLLPGRVPLITRLVAAIDATTPDGLAPELNRYTCAVTTTWALALGLLGLGNLMLALVAQPRGLLAMFGLQAPFGVTEVQWAWLANWLNYGIVGGVMLVEYGYRKWRFPGRYKNAADFVRKVAALDAAFWRDFLR